MKRILIVFVAISLAIASVYAQAPQKMSYQAVVRNSSNVLVANTQIGMEINIRQESPSGTIVYTEIQTPTTNFNGLVSIEIGSNDGFNAIDWGHGPFFIETNIALEPPLTNYTLTSTSQLLSVPYALYSNLGGLNVVKLHAQDELNIVFNQASSINIGDISTYKGLILEWRMNDRTEVFHQFIYLSDYDKEIILGRISTPANYPRRYTTILSDGFATMMWLGVSLQGTQLYLSTNSHANPTPRLQRLYAIL